MEIPRHFAVEMQSLEVHQVSSRRRWLQFLLLSKKVPGKYFYYAKEQCRRALNKKKPSTFERGGSLLVLNKSSYHGDLYLLLQH